MGQVLIEQKRFLSTFLFSEFKLENIYSGVNLPFPAILFCGNLFLRIAGKIVKIPKLEPAIILCHTVVSPQVAQVQQYEQVVTSSAGLI